MAVSRQTSRSRFTLVLLILTTITLVTLDLRGFGPLESARDETLEFLAPVKNVAGRAVEPVSDAWNGAFGYDDLEVENEELRRRIAELEGELARSSDAERTLEQLTQELGIDWVDDIEQEVATVVAGPVSNFDPHTIEIDRGSDDGIATGMPVVTHAGLVGSVDRVSASRSRVRLVSDPGFRVAVRLVDLDEDETGVARGQGRGRPLIVFEGINADLEVPEGTLVVTSGLERTLFPGHLVVGNVRSALTSEGSLDQDLLVDPLADLDSLSFVVVLLWEPEP